MPWNAGTATLILLMCIIIMPTLARRSRTFPGNSFFWFRRLFIKIFILIKFFTSAHLEQIENRHFPILTNQIELHPYLQEQELVLYCQNKGIIVTAYRPIQKGKVDEEPSLREMATKHQKTPVQVTLRWLFQRGIVSIPKATSKKHLLENLAIFDFSLSEEEMHAISLFNTNQRFVFG
jgi:2,5-diketo-D-gluconate reductase B